MYKITRIKEISIEFSTIVEELINRYIDEELQEDEFLIDVKYFKTNHTASNLNYLSSIFTLYTLYIVLHFLKSVLYKPWF